MQWDSNLSYRWYCLGQALFSFWVWVLDFFFSKGEFLVKYLHCRPLSVQVYVPALNVSQTWASTEEQQAAEWVFQWDQWSGAPVWPCSMVTEPEEQRDRGPRTAGTLGELQPSSQGGPLPRVSGGVAPDQRTAGLLRGGGAGRGGRSWRRSQGGDEGRPRQWGLGILGHIAVGIPENSLVLSGWLIIDQAQIECCVCVCVFEGHGDDSVLGCVTLKTSCYDRK